MVDSEQPTYLLHFCRKNRWTLCLVDSETPTYLLHFLKKWDKVLCLVDVQILHDFIGTRSTWSYRTSQANLHPTKESYMRKYVPSFSNKIKKVTGVLWMSSQKQSMLKSNLSTYYFIALSSMSEDVLFSF